MPLALGRLSGCSFIFRTIVYRHVSMWRGTRGIKLKRLLGWQIYSGMSWSSCFYSIIQYGLGNGPSALLYCHWVSSEVGQFSYPHPCICEEECSIPSLICLQTLPIECLPQKSIALPGPMTTASVSPALASRNISSTTGAVQACEGGGMSPPSSVKVTHISKQCFVLRWPNGGLWTGDNIAEL